MLSRIKAFLRSILPTRLRGALRRLYEDLRDWIDTIVFGLQFSLRRQLRPEILLFFGFAPGDDLMCTAVLRELRQRGHHPLMIVTDHPALFAGNPDVAYIRPLWRRYSTYDSTVAICRRYVRIWGGEFRELDYAPPTEFDRRRVPARHVIAAMCVQAGVTDRVLLRPELNLTPAETAAAEWAQGRIVAQSSGLAARHPARNKEWQAERFDAVLDALHGEFEFVQLGSAGDPAIRHARDLRGATTIRDAAAILHHARLFVGLEGFLMHLARAVECPSVIVFGGRVAPWQIGYSCNANLYSDVACAPCWRNNTCDFDRMCMTQIGAADVVAAIRRMLQRPRNPLVVDSVEIALPHPPS